MLAKYKPEDRPKLALAHDDLAIFQYSGGTTGISKAAVSTHYNLVVNGTQIKSWMPDCKDGQEIVLMAIPLFHVYGMVAGMIFAVLAGSSMVMVPNPRDMKDVLANIDKFHPSIYPGVPTMYNAINNNPDVIAGKHDLRSIKACLSGSAPLMRETKERFEKITGGKLVEGYGLSEAPTATHCNPLYAKNPRTGSIGLPLPDVDCRIVSLDDGVSDMKVGEIGELAIRSPNVMKGYHNMPTETANTLREGWLFTGDIARMDEDGYFYIVDRKKELIKPGGYQVWPREVEEVITEHPKVLECGVAGIPDAYRGETVKAWVVVKPGQTMTPDDVRGLVQGAPGALQGPDGRRVSAGAAQDDGGQDPAARARRQDREKQPDAKPEPRRLSARRSQLTGEPSARRASLDFDSLRIAGGLGGGRGRACRRSCAQPAR